jgi:hypothetical protein
MMASCQGHLLSRELTQQLYRRTAGDAKLQWDSSRLCVPSSGPLHPYTLLHNVEKSIGNVSSTDLRQAIMQLQFYCQRQVYLSGGAEGQIIWMQNSVPDVPKACSTRGAKFSKSLRKCVEGAELESYCDAILNRPFDRQCEIIEPDQYHNSSNDVQGQGSIMLFKPRVKMETVTLASLGREEEILRSLLGDEESKDFDSFDERRLTASIRLNDLLNSVNVSCGRVPSWESVVDYGSLISNMIQADDDEEAAHNARVTVLLQEAQQEQGTPNYESASRSLLKMGIRPSRHSTKLLLERGHDGLLALGKREADYSRWILVDRQILDAARRNRFT